jgi:hypothetical protein
MSSLEALHLTFIDDAICSAKNNKTTLKTDLFFFNGSKKFTSGILCHTAHR